MEDIITSTEWKKIPVSQNEGEELSLLNQNADMTEKIAPRTDKPKVEEMDISIIQSPIVVEGCEASSSVNAGIMPAVPQGSNSSIIKSENCNVELSIHVILCKNELDTNEKKRNVSCDNNPLVTSSPSLNHLLTSSTVPSDHLNLDNPSTTPPLSTSQPSSTLAATLSTSTSPPLLAETQELSDLLSESQSKIQLCMSGRWQVIKKPNALQVVMLSELDNVVIQRIITCSLSGKLDVYVHCQPICAKEFLESVPSDVPLSRSTVDQFVDRIVTTVYRIRDMEVCSGLDSEELKPGWCRCALGEIDKNPFQESRYTETFRSLSCLRLVKKIAKICSECAKLHEPLKKCADFAAVTNEEQRLRKLNEQETEINNATREKIEILIKKEGVALDRELSDSLVEILKCNFVSPLQVMFVEEQTKASKKNRGMRWHPALVRLALALHLSSLAVREVVESTGMMKLPCGRTLVDHSRVQSDELGVDLVVLKSLTEEVEKFEHRHQKYHVILADEMQVLVGIVFQKSTGRMVGFRNLGGVDKEARLLEAFLENVYGRQREFYFASKSWVFMVNGVWSGTQEVIATYASILSKSELYLKVWELINGLEISGIPVLALVWNMCSVVRDFIKIHKTKNVLPSGVIFETVHLSAPYRSIYFVSSPPQLFNSIRNCVYNSSTDRMIGRRRMMRNGEAISWDSIIRLYESKEKRKNLKLNAVNVYPDNYARMDVKITAEVLNRNVARALEDEDGASELVVFLRFVNDWYDCVYGSDTTDGKGYTSQEDGRFEFLMSFLTYLEEWTQEANVEVDAGAPASKKTLSEHTLQEVEMTTRSFVAMVKFLLSEGMESVNARVFSVGPFEQYFKLRTRRGDGDADKQAPETEDTIGQSIEKMDDGEGATTSAVSIFPSPK